MANLLNDLMSKVDKGAAQKSIGEHPSKRARKEDNDNGIPVFVALCQGLEDVWKANKDNDNKNSINAIELEVRLGMIVMDHERRWRAQRACDIVKEGACSTKMIPPHISSTLEFKAGIDEIAIERIRKILNDKKRFNKANQPVEKVRYERDNHNRWIVNDDGSMKEGENKSRFLKNDCALLAHEYDIRIDANYEIPLSNNGDRNMDVKDFKVKCERIKRRTTYTSTTPEFKAWKIDVTEVNLINFNDKGIPYGQSHEFELEFELVNLDLFKESVEDNARQIIKEIGSELFRLVNLFIASDISTNPGQFMTPCGSPFVLDQIKRRNESISGNDFEFIGSMPINMMRSSLKKVLRSDYYLTEKSDGTRYLLYVVHQDEATKTPIAVLIDRARNIFKIPGCEIIGKALEIGTVLDGELVFNFTTKSNIFLTFDILALKAEPMVSLNFKSRLYALQKLMVNYQRRLPPTTDGVVITEIVDKLFVQKNQISNLISKIILENGDRVFKDGDGRMRHHRTDGIIFQPDGPYVHSTDLSLLKWKWPELRSVDLEVIQPIIISEGVTLQCSGPDNTRINCINGDSNQSKLGIFDTYRLNADAQVSYNKIIIAEVVFDEKIGKWGYLRLRKDKSEPNYIATVLGVSMEQSEALGIEELEYRLLAKDETQDDWDVHLNKMVNQLLNFQRQRISS